MREVKFGLFFPQVGLPFSKIKERVQLADRLGYDAVYVVDHMWSRGIPDLEHLEAWTLMTAMAMSTERIRIGALVLCHSFRHPALLAKMASTLDVISGGRLVLGLGAGWMDEEYRAYGYPFPPTSRRIEELDEGVEIIKRLFTEPRATYAGKHYTVTEAVNYPKPVQQPHPPILIGGGGARRLLRVVARHADIWNCPNNHAAELPQRLEALREHCAAVGRNPDDIEVSEQCVIVLGRSAEAFRQQWALAKQTVGRVFELEQTAFRGTPDEVAQQIRARVAQGVTYFTFLLSDFHASESLELFAERVIPAVRAP